VTLVPVAAARLVSSFAAAAHAAQWHVVWQPAAPHVRGAQPYMEGAPFSWKTVTFHR